MRCTLRRSYGFEAAHVLPKVPDGHPCKRMHGHSYRVDVVVEGAIDSETGWLIDFGDLDAHVRPLIDALDHRTLNDIDGLSNPTCELVARWFWQKLEATLPIVAAIRVSETRDSSCEVRG